MASSSNSSAKETSSTSFFGQSPDHFFWRYFDHVGRGVDGGTYSRHSPPVWSGGQDSSGLQAAPIFPVAVADVNDNVEKNGAAAILRLSSRPRLSQGPRRRRDVTNHHFQEGIPPEQLLQLSDGIDVWNKLNRDPIMNKDFQIIIREFFEDVKFKLMIVMIADGAAKLVFASVALWLIYPLVKNWLSSRKCDEKQKAAAAEHTFNDRSLDLEQALLSVDEGQDWMEALSEKIEGGTGQFLCCLIESSSGNVDDDKNSVWRTAAGGNFLKCSQRRKKKKLNRAGVNSLEKSPPPSSLECVSDLVYEVVVGNNDRTTEEKIKEE